MKIKKKEEILYISKTKWESCLKLDENLKFKLLEL